MPAERLGGDPALADSTRRAAADERLTATGSNESNAEGGTSEQSAVEAFLDDAEKIEVIKQQARSEAQERAQQWEF